VSGRAEFFLGVIAVATLSTALVQISVLVAAGLLFRRIQKLIDRVEHELKPVFESVQSVARDAARATSLATAQVERIDRAMTDLMHRLESALNTIQGFVSGPFTEGMGWFNIVRMIFKLFSGFRSAGRRSRGDEEDALFI
jgi:predicted PurR-regulated permease PerM